MKNSFDEMEEANIKSFYAGPGEQNIRRKITSSLGTMRFLGHIADVYVNRFVDTVVGMASGPDSESKKKLPRGSKGQRSEDSSDALGSSKYPNL